MNVYTEFHRADGHVLWAHLDQGEGQQFNRSPGNLYSNVCKIHLEGAGTFNLSLEKTIPPLLAPPDSQWVKHRRVRSLVQHRAADGRWLHAGATYVSLNVGLDLAMTWQESLACAAHFCH